MNASPLRATPSKTFSAPLRRLPAALAVAAVLGAGALSVAVMPAVAQAAQSAQSAEQWVPGRLLVQPKPGLPEAEFDKILKVHGGKQVGKIDKINVRIIQLPANASEKAVAALLKGNKHIKFAERDMILKSQATANDPYYPSEWHLSKINASSAWDISQGQQITVAILDSGVDGAHPDLASKMVAGWNFYENNSNTSDVYGHGTMVAGAAAAISNNATGVAGVAGSSSIMPIRVTDTAGSGYLSMMASGITWAADRGARVANLSFEAAGGYSTVQSAAQYMKNKGGLVVTAAGNSGAQQSFSASDTNIVVSATDSNDVKTSWSNYGNFVDVAAPGVSIWTTTNGGGYSAVSGTSVASPVTAGVVALMMAANPGLGSADVEKALFSSAVDLGSAGLDIYYGYGRVDAAAAVQAATAAKSADTTAPTVSINNPAAGSTVQGLVAVDVSASDNIGVARVDLIANGTKVASDITAPYGFSWDSTTVADGSATLTAYAYDAAGNSSSRAISVNVANAGGASSGPSDTTAPMALITNPGPDATVSGTVSVKGSATDDVAVTTTRLYIDGKLVSSVSGSTLTYNWNTRKVTSGAHQVVLEALDAAGNKASTSISVTR